MLHFEHITQTYSSPSGQTPVVSSYFWQYMSGL